MGRHYYLETLALGRSPFADDASTEIQSDSRASGEPATPEDKSGRNSEHVQQYNAKGRPINPAVEDRKRELRHAQNEVLAIAGVVESRERIAEVKATIASQHRQAVLLEEERRGDETETFLDMILWPSVVYFPQALVSRVQANVCPAATFGDILLGELQHLRRVRLWKLAGMLLPGASVRLLCATLTAIVGIGIEDTVARIDSLLLEHANEAQYHHLRKVVSTFDELGRTMVDVALLPLSYYGWAQTLGLAPAWSLSPGLAMLIPFRPGSLHGLLWKPLAPNSSFAVFTSPAALMLVWSLVTRNRDAEHPAGTLITRFSYPAVNTRLTHEPLHFLADPLARICSRLAIIRQCFLSWAGYNLFETPSLLPVSPHRLDNHTVAVEHWPGPRDPPPQQYRSTTLALLTPYYLAHRIDSMLARPLLLVLETATLRAIVRSYITSPLPQTALAATLAQSGMGGVTLKPWQMDWNKLGLSLALYAAAETGVFFALYGIVRWQGVKNLAWGRPDLGGVEQEFEIIGGDEE